MTEDHEARIAALEQRVATLETALASGMGSVAPARRRSGGDGGAATFDAGAVPSEPYAVAQLELESTWIEMHEPSARRQLHRLICETVQVEGPIVDELALKRVREAWGIKRAGARLQEVFEQNVRQLVTGGRVDRIGDALVAPNAAVDTVRVPGDGDDTKRSADEVPLAELRLAIERIAAAAPGIDLDELTAGVGRLFGWARRGTAVQARLDRAVEQSVRAGAIELDGRSVRALQSTTVVQAAP